HQHAVGGFEWPEHPPPRGHDHIAVAQGRVVDPRVVEGHAELRELSTHHEHERPDGDLDHVSGQREEYRQRDDREVDPEGLAGKSGPSFAAYDVDARDQRERVDDDGAEDRAGADREGRPERDGPRGPRHDASRLIASAAGRFTLDSSLAAPASAEDPSPRRAWGDGRERLSFERE